MDGVSGKQTNFTAPSGIAESLEAIILKVVTQDNIEALASAHDMTVDYASFLIDTQCNEARVGLSLIEPSLRPGARVLEVGSGIGLLAGVLAREGIDIVGIEPGGDGFGFMPTLAKMVARAVDISPNLTSLPVSVTDLDPSQHGIFDLVYSVNVLEHVIALDEALAAMTRVLAPGGRMVHMSPNYTVPYEPHLGIPLVPGMPGLTRHLFPRRVSRHVALWENLNFVTAGRLRRLAKRNGLGMSLDAHVMGDMVRRILKDPIFANRHGGFISAVSRFLVSSGGLVLIDRIPPGLASPMVSRYYKGRT
jgi:2-polyprenyl-3-methyl-5-hydroxy-6-metoxy-1,4-benzoquinol methylase